jgi:fatty acid desaturase
MATVDRPLLGWIGRVFFHNVSHDHIAHHFFSTTPFYNQPKVTEHLKKLFGEEYNYDSTVSFLFLAYTFGLDI